MALSSIMSSPFSLVIFQRLTIAFIIVFTSKDSSLRPLFFPILIAWNIHLLPRYQDSITRPPWIAFVAGENLSGVLYYAEKVLLRKWSLSDYPILDLSPNSAKGFSPSGEKEADSRDLTFTDRLRVGLSVSFSDRYNSSPHQTPNTPPYSSSHPTYIPSRTQFLLKKLLIITTSYLLVDILSQGNQPHQNPSRYASSQIPIFSRLYHRTLTAEELLIRITTSLGFWFGAFLVIQCYYSTLQFLAVLLRFSDPEHERPIFGNVLVEACTLRGFWGRGWHLLMRERLVTGANWLTIGGLRLRSRAGSEQSRFTRLFKRYTHLTFVFALSGVFHWGEDLAQGLGWTESGAVVFFLLMAVGIMIEDAVQWFWADIPTGSYNFQEKKSGRTSDDVKTVSGKGWWMKGVGYLWVVCWFSVATPWYA